MRISWIIGSRGLLGSAFTRALSVQGGIVFAPSELFRWEDSLQLELQIKAAVSEFSAVARHGVRWEIFWAAGVGTMSSTDELLSPETRALGCLLECIRANDHLMATRGTIIFSSSAGAIYGACNDQVITEKSEPRPTNAYARAKLRQEALLHDFCRSVPHIGVLIARISTLYGVGQNKTKQQGLLTSMARNVIRNKPIGIFVPIDTIRDYIAADDASAEVIGIVREKLEEQPRALTKIVASETPATIAEIISIFKRIARKPPRVTTSASRASNQYARRVQFHSVVQRGSNGVKCRSLVVGIAQLLEAERFLYANPELPGLAPLLLAGQNK